MHADFLAAICAEPDDLTHRLVYADWLTDNGTSPLDTARAELIRVQIAREAADEDDWSLRARERWLLARWNKGLAGDLRHRVRRYHCRRGFGEAVELSPAQCADPTWRALAPIRAVRPVGRLADFDPEVLRAYPELDLTRATPTDRLTLLLYLDPARLRRLVLARPWWGFVADLLAGGRLTALESLDLGGNPTVSRELRRVRREDGPLPDLLKRPVPPRLRTLALPGVWTTAERVGFLASPWLASLTSLTVRGRHAGAEGSLLEAISHAPGATSLRELYLLGGTTLETRGNPGPYLRELRTLDLAHDEEFGYPFDVQQADWFAVLPLPELRSLRFALVHLSNEAAARLVCLPGWPKLHSLDVQPFGYQGSGPAEALARSPLAPHLRRLVLRNVNASALVNAWRNHAQNRGRLRELCLHGIGAPRIETLTMLAASPWLQELTTLEVPLDDRGAEADLDPAAWPGLRWLDLRGWRLPTRDAWRQRLGPGFRYSKVVAQWTAAEIPF